MSRCAWCAQTVHPELPFARRDDGDVWHAECFLKFLAHKDELAGIRRDHPLQAARTMFCPKCLGPMVRDVRLEQAENGGPLIEGEEFECAAGCERAQPEAQERG